MTIPIVQKPALHTTFLEDNNSSVFVPWQCGRDGQQRSLLKSVTSINLEQLQL